MQNPNPKNPIDEICQQLSMAYLLADRDDPDIHLKYVDNELDGLYEFAKIILSIKRQNPALLRATELLLQSVGLQIKYPLIPQFDARDGPHIFIANHPGSDLVDTAIGTRLIARLGLAPSIVGVKNMNIAGNENECIAVEHPRIQQQDPRSNAQIAAVNTRSMLEMRNMLIGGRGLLLFPGAGLYRSFEDGHVLVDRSFDRLAPMLLACQGLRPKLHLFHIDYELPSWWTGLHDVDRAQFYATQWRAVLSLRQQVATVRHLKSISIDHHMDKQQRFALCRQMLDLVNEQSIALNHAREPVAEQVT